MLFVPSVHWFDEGNVLWPRDVGGCWLRKLMQFLSSQSVLLQLGARWDNVSGNSGIDKLFRYLDVVIQCVVYWWRGPSSHRDGAESHRFGTKIRHGDELQKVNWPKKHLTSKQDEGRTVNKERISVKAKIQEMKKNIVSRHEWTNLYNIWRQFTCQKLYQTTNF